MSDTNTPTTGGGSYVPPHRRKGATAEGNTPPPVDTSTSNQVPRRTKSKSKSPNNQNNNQLPGRINSRNKNAIANSQGLPGRINSRNKNAIANSQGLPGRSNSKSKNANSQGLPGRINSKNKNAIANSQGLPGKSNSKNKNPNQNRHRQPFRGGGWGGRGGKSKSPGPKRHNSSRSKSPGNHHYYAHLTKEQLQHQREQLHVLTAAVTRICCINLERREDRWASFQQHLHQSLGKKMGHSLSTKVMRYNAVDGLGAYSEADLPTLVQSTWDATINAKYDRHIAAPMTKEMSEGEVGCALSHIQLWKELVDIKDENPPENELQQPTMMILEDDALFYSPKLAMNKQAVRDLSPPRGNSPTAPITYNHDFLTAFQLAWTQLPEDWDIWYLGFSDRGDRLPVDQDFHLPKHHHHDNKHPTMQVQLFRPTYGFHTHGYIISQKAAKKLLDNLPVTGPLDVWLADNQWFDMKVYCSVVEGEGWHETGAWLITQNRKANSNIPVSSRADKEKDMDKEKDKS